MKRILGVFLSVVLGFGTVVVATAQRAGAAVGTSSLTIVTSANPQDAQDFAFTTTGPGLSSFSLDDDANPTLSNTKTFSALVASTYTITESATAGWALTNLFCDDGVNNVNLVTRTATIALPDNTDVTCSFDNTQDNGTGSITILKDAHPDDPQDFSFSTTGTGLSSFSLDDDPSDATLDNTKTFDNLNAGSYTITEAAVGGWSLTGLTCDIGDTDLGTRTATINLPPDTAEFCTFTNTSDTAPSSITVSEDSHPDSPQDFSFSTTGSGLSSFSLDDDTDPTLDNTKTFDNLTPGTFTITEDALPAGWTLDDLSCDVGNVDLGTRTATIDLPPDTEVNCGFTNKSDKGRITIIKDTQPDDPQDFAFTTTGTGLSPFSLDDDPGDATLSNTKSFDNLDPGAFTITEGVTTGWKLNSIECNEGDTDLPTRTASITLAAGDDVTCTFTNIVPPIVIDNGVIQLGLNREADLNVEDNLPSEGGVTAVGLRYMPTNAESTAPGCLCEGWGAADQTSGVTGYADVSVGTANVTPISQVVTPSSAILVNQIGDTFLVTHDYHPSSSPNLYEVTVSIKNISNVDTHLRYRRVMDWDIEPTAFNEYVTMETGNASELVFTSDNGFASANALSGPSQILFSGEAVDSGPADHGGLFDFDFGTLGAGETKTFKTFYGAAGNETDILQALGSVGAEAYSLGQPSTPDGPTLGTPNTFAFGFSGIGGNPALGSITINKDAQPDSGQDVSFTTTGTGLSPFSLDDDADPTLPNTKTFSGLLPGTYTVTEGADAGTVLSGLDCSTGGTGNTGTRTATITIVAGENVNCTFTNVTPGSITITKNAIPDAGVDFPFTTTGTGLSPFSLDDDADPTLPNTTTFTGLLPGSYSVTEGTVANWKLTGLDCSTGGSGDTSTRTATIDLAAGANVTCTYTNTKLGSITITKDAIPDAGVDFPFTTTGTGLSPFSLDDDADPTLPNTTTFTGLLPGSYSVTEGTVANWKLTGLDCSTGGSGDTSTRTATIDLAAGANVTCTYTNTKLGSITITKDAIPNAGVDFPFTTTGTGLSPFSLDDDADPTLPNTTTFTGLLPGSYSVSEGTVTNWKLTGLDCTTGGTGDTSTRIASITLVAGANVTCTYTNTKLGSITITKNAVPDSPQDFGFTTTGTGLSPFSLDDDADPTLPNTTTFTGLLPGSYSVTEGAVAGWQLTGLDCSAGGSGDTGTGIASITLDAGANVTCTYTNTQANPEKGTITIVKDAIPDSPQDFAFTTTGTGLSPFSLDDDNDPTLANSQTFSNIDPGSYTVTEGAVSGWALTGLVCVTEGGVQADFVPLSVGTGGDIGTRTATIELAAGTTVTCTYTNTKLGSITITKDAIPDAGVDFPFTTIGAGLAPFSLDDDADPTLPNTTTFTGLFPGSYSVTEGTVTNWKLTGLDCSTGGTGDTGTRTASIELLAGANVTCTYTNTKLGSITITKDAIPDAGVDFPFTTTGTGLSPFSLDDDADPTLPNTTTFTGLLPGSYSVTEGTVTNWKLTGLDCTTGGSGDTATRIASITLVAGANVTCTYTNTKLGSITITKDAIPDAAVDFPFTTTGTGLSPFSLDDDADPTLPNTTTFTGLLPGSYSVTEGTVTNWKLTGLDCTTGGSGDTATRIASITLVAGANVTCTYTNTKLGSITITKNAVPDNAQDFAFTTTGTGLSPFSLDDDADPTLPNTTTFTGLLPGSFSVTEGAVGGWKLTGLDCSAGGSGDTGTGIASITLVAGANVTCTYTNTQQNGGGNTLTSLSDAHLWVGLKNSDDQGTQFDVVVELLENGQPVASGVTRCVTGLTRNAASAKEVVVPWGPFAPVSVDPGDVLSLRVSTRIGTNANGTKCTGPGGSHNNAVGLRLYYDASNRVSHFDTTVGDSTDVLQYLHSDGGGCDKPSATKESQNVTTRFLDSNAPTTTNVKCKDSAGVNFNGGNALKEVGEWALQPAACTLVRPFTVC